MQIASPVDASLDDDDPSSVVVPDDDPPDDDASDVDPLGASVVVTPAVVPGSLVAVGPGSVDPVVPVVLVATAPVEVEPSPAVSMLSAGGSPPHAVITRLNTVASIARRRTAPE